MRILYISYYYLPHMGGGTWPAYYLTSQLVDRGHQVILVVPNVSHRMLGDPRECQALDESNPAVLHRTPSLPLPRLLGPILAVPFVFGAAIRDVGRADVIVAQYHPHHFMPAVALALGKLFHKPVVVRACDLYRSMGVEDSGLHALVVKAANSLNERLIPSYDYFLTVASEDRADLLLRLDAPSLGSKLGISPNGFDRSVCNDTALFRDTSRELLGIRSGERVILFIGRYSGEEYAVTVLLEGLSLIKDCGLELKLILVGDCASAPLFDMITRLGLAERVKVFGPSSRTEISQFIAASDLCIGPLMPTRTVPLKVVEYMACGKTVLTGKGSISRDLGEEGNSYLAVPPVPEMIASTIIGILKDAGLSERVSTNARRTVQSWTWEAVAVRLEVVLANAILRGSRGGESMKPKDIQIKTSKVAKAGDDRAMLNWRKGAVGRWRR